MRNAKCQNCKKKFHSSTGKLYCRACRNYLNMIPNASKKRNQKNKLKRLCEDVLLHQSEIYLLATKEKWGLLNQIDFFRVANIYMLVVCNENRYAQKEPDVQVQMMLKELVDLIEFRKIDATNTKYKTRAIVQLDKNGIVVRTFQSMKHASQVLDYSTFVIKRTCEGYKTAAKEILKWKSEI